MPQPAKSLTSKYHKAGEKKFNDFFNTNLNNAIIIGNFWSFMNKTLIIFDICFCFFYQTAATTADEIL